MAKREMWLVLGDKSRSGAWNMPSPYFPHMQEGIINILLIQRGWWDTGSKEGLDYVPQFWFFF